MLIPPGKKLVMIGDSITDYDRKRPIGEGRDGMGNSYVVLVDSLLKITYPQSRIRIVNMGTSGNNVRDLKDRWTTDVLELEPDWVSILIGANDVWRQFDLPLLTERHVYLEEYEEKLEDLVCLTKKKVEGVILMTPFYMEPNLEDPMRKTMSQYANVVKKLAQKHGCPLVDVQKAFDDYMQHYSAQSIAWDRIHPNVAGHMLIAKAFLNTIGYEWAPEHI